MLPFHHAKFLVRVFCLENLLEDKLFINHLGNACFCVKDSCEAVRIDYLHFLANL